VPSAEPLVFANITPEQYARLTQKANAAGISMSGDSGTASSFGVEVSWNYSAAAQQLTLQVLNTPFFMGPDAVNAQIQKLVKETVS
jgi:hypothetical protein